MRGAAGFARGSQIGGKRSRGLNPPYGLRSIIVRLKKIAAAKRLR
jgi:hypothetical protein